MTQLEKMKQDYNRNKEIKTLLDSGITLQEVSERYDVSVGLPSYLKKNYYELQCRLDERIQTTEWVADLFRDGYTMDQIADLEKTTKQNIYRILKNSGLSRLDGGKHVLKTDYKQRVKELNDRGYTIEEMEMFLGIDAMRIRSYAYEDEIQLKSSVNVHVKEITEKILELRDLGYSQDEISKMVNHSQSYVSKILVDNGMRKRLTRDEYIVRDDKIIEDYKKGMSIKQLTVKYDENEHNIRRILYKC